jgi:hypothetical protein
MPESSRELVALIARGADHELSSVAFTIAKRVLKPGGRRSQFPGRGSHPSVTWLRPMPCSRQSLRRRSHASHC